MATSHESLPMFICFKLAYNQIGPYGLTSLRHKNWPHINQLFFEVCGLSDPDISHLSSLSKTTMRFITILNFCKLLMI